MADIEIVYRVPYCDFNCNDIDTQCFTEYACETGCKCFFGEPRKESIINGIKTVTIPFGNCLRAHFKYIYKGWSGKRYEMEERHDPYNPHLDCMEVMLGNKLFDCVKVTLNGKCVYNEYDDEPKEET